MGLIFTILSFIYVGYRLAEGRLSLALAIQIQRYFDIGFEGLAMLLGGTYHGGPPVLFMPGLLVRSWPGGCYSL